MPWSRCDANQPAEALLELEHRLGQLVIGERIAAGGANRLEPGFEQRPVGHAERQLGDDHVLQRVARHVDALPEAVGAEQHAPAGWR